MANTRYTAVADIARKNLISDLVHSAGGLWFSSFSFVKNGSTQIKHIFQRCRGAYTIDRLQRRARNKI